MKLFAMRMFAALLILPVVLRLESPKTIEEVQRLVSRLLFRIKVARVTFSYPLPAVFIQAERLGRKMQEWLDEQALKHDEPEEQTE